MIRDSVIVIIRKKYSLRCKIKFSQSITCENITSAISEQDDDLGSKETLRTISRTLTLGDRISEIQLETGAEI